MGIPAPNQLFAANHAGVDNPDDPSLFTVSEMVAGVLDSSAVSTATSAAVSTVNAAAPDSTSVSQARSQAVSAAAVGSVADSKAVSASAPTSTADSKAVSVSLNTSVADSKAESGVLAASRATSVLQTAFSTSPGIPFPALAGETGIASLYYTYGDARRYGANPSFTAGANTTALQNALTAAPFAGGQVRVTAGSYSISGELQPLSNTTIVLDPGVVITQTVPNKNIFRVVQKDNVWIHCNGAVLYGEGSWSAAWNDFASHDDRGVQFLGCTNSGMTNPRIRNMAMAGIVIMGGTNITIDNPIIEGTHALGHPLVYQVSIYQFGMVIMHDPTYGEFQGVHINNPTIYNVAMGINSVENIALSNGLLSITNPVIYDIRGQHGMYMGTSNTTITNPTIDNVGLDGIKIFSGAIAEQLRNVVITGFNISGAPGQAVELGVSGAGFLQSPHITGTAYNCGRTLTIDGDVRGARCSITSDTMTQYALYMAQGSGTGPTDCEIDVVSRRAATDGVIVAASTSARNRIRAKVYRPSTGGGGFRGIFVSACASLTLESPECFDDASNMAFGIYMDTPALGVKITGTPRMLGYTTKGIAGLGGVEWHGSGGEFSSLTTAFFDTADKIVPITPMSLGVQTVSASNLNAWKLTLEDESAYLVEAVIVGKLLGSAQRGSFKTSIVCYRDAAGVATLEGAEFNNTSRVSASFLGAYSWNVTGNAVRLLANSGAAATTTDWIMTIRATRLVG